MKDSKRELYRDAYYLMGNVVKAKGKNKVNNLNELIEINNVLDDDYITDFILIERELSGCGYGGYND